ncbi:MAG: FtsX-like permease family protein [Bacteroidota bacterium]|nr:FtsX-like permease family protein [Bacteroidota bacterium]
MIVRLAWRNIWRNQRRTILTILAVLFACFFLLVQQGMDRGADAEQIRFMVSLFTGAMQVQREGYLENPSLRRSFMVGREFLDRLRADDGVTGCAPRIETQGLVAREGQSLGTALFGIDPSREQGTSTILSRVTEGRCFLAADASEIVVGHVLLANLGGRIGDTVVVLTQGFDGAFADRRFRIVGTIKTGSTEFDGTVVLLPLRSFQEMLAMEGKVTAIAVTVRDIHEIRKVRDHIAAALAGTGLVVPTWEEIMPDVKQSKDLNEWGGRLFLVILMIVVGFGILNTILMSVTERFGEFGILLAVGMPQCLLVSVVFIETIFILFLGMLAGNLLALPINAWIEAHPIRLTGEWAFSMEQYGYQPIIPSTTRPSIFLWIDAAIAGITLLLAAYPLIRVWRLEPLKGIRHT